MNKKKFKEVIVMLADDIEKDAIEKAYCNEVWGKLKDIFLDPPYRFMKVQGDNFPTTLKLQEHKKKYKYHHEFMRLIEESFEERMK